MADRGPSRSSARKDTRAGERAEANNLELACVPANAGFLNRIESHFTALRHFALNGTDHRKPEPHRDRGPSVAVRGNADGAYRPSGLRSLTVLAARTPVRYASVDTAIWRPAALQGDTRRNSEETAR